MNSSIYISTMAVRAFGAEAAGYGILMSIMAVGAVGGSLLNASRAAPTLKTIIDRRDAVRALLRALRDGSRTTGCSPSRWSRWGPRR